MKVTNKVLLQSVSGLRELSALHLPVKLSYAIGKNIRKIQEALNDHTAEACKIMNRYAPKGQLSPDAVQREKQTNEMDELNNLEVDINCHKIDVSLLLACDVKVTPGTLSDLGWLLIDKDEEVPQTDPAVPIAAPAVPIAASVADAAKAA